MGKKLKQYPTA